MVTEKDMLKKIISGGQTGADQAALDVAINMGIPHGGWIPKGRLTENGPLEDKYLLQEMDTANYHHRTEQNVVDSDGTLIISHGALTGGSEYTRQMATQHNRPLLHIDLNRTIAFQAAQKIRSWIEENNIEVLNVAGPRASKDPKIYQATVDVLEAAFHLNIISMSIPDRFVSPDKPMDRATDGNFPLTVDQAVDKLLSRLSLREKTMIANIPEDNLLNLYHSLEDPIQNEFKLWLGNDALMESCRAISGQQVIDGLNAALIILNTLWKSLQKTNVLRIVK